MTDKNKDKKGFTLIELLVVVAIIGALAAVGVVAYNGYIGAARENATKSIHNSVVKYIANERGKCALDENTMIFGGAVSCSTTGTSEASFIVTTLVASTGPLQDKDPYDGGMAVVNAAPAKARGNVVLTASNADETITLKTFYDKDSSEFLESKVSVGE